MENEKENSGSRSPTQTTGGSLKLREANKEKPASAAGDNKVTEECRFLKSFEKSSVFFLVNGLRSTVRRERLDLVELLKADSNNAEVWKALLDHVSEHNAKPGQANSRMRLYLRAQSLIPDSSTSEAHLAIWLDGAQASVVDGSYDKARSIYDAMGSKQIGAASSKFYLQLSSFEAEHGRGSVAAVEVLDLGLTKVKDNSTLVDARRRILSSDTSKDTQVPPAPPSSEDVKSPTGLPASNSEENSPDTSSSFSTSPDNSSSSSSSSGDSSPASNTTNSPNASNDEQQGGKVDTAVTTKHAKDVSSSSSSGGGETTKHVMEIPDYMKNFDWEKVNQKFKNKESSAAAAVTVDTREFSSAAPPPPDLPLQLTAPAVSVSTPVVPAVVAYSRGNRVGGGAASGTSAPNPPPPPASVLRGSRLLRTGLGGLNRLGGAGCGSADNGACKGGGGAGCHRVGGPLRVSALDADQELEDLDTTAATVTTSASSSSLAATQHEESNPLMVGGVAEELIEAADNGFETTLHSGDLGTLAEGSFESSVSVLNSSALSVDTSGTSSGTRRDSSSSSATPSSSSSRRSSASSSRSSGEGAGGGGRKASLSTSLTTSFVVEDPDDDDATVCMADDTAAFALPLRSGDGGGGNDDTAVVFKQRVGSGARQESAEEEEDTAVVFKGTSSTTRAASSSSTGAAGNKGVTADDDENTAVVFKGRRREQQVLSSSNADANPSSLTIEAGNGSKQSKQIRPRQQQSHRHRHKSSHGRHNGSDSDTSDQDDGSDSGGSDGGGRSRTTRRFSGRGSGGSGRDGAAAEEDLFEGHFAGMFTPDKAVSVAGRAYFKIGVLGKGGSSKVYRVLSSEGDIFALKRVRVSSNDPKCLEGFKNEIALMESLKGNPCIVQLLSASIDDGGRTIHMVMEVGETDLNGLLQRHKRQGSLCANFVRLAWQQMLTAVSVIHEERIVHGDLKPANFLFVQGHLKLIDFGIAKQIESQDTTNIYRESQVGTLNYMSPEAIQDSGGGSGNSPGGGGGKPRMKLGRASDIWSLGCILYQMVYGHTPFSHITSLMTKLMAIIDVRHAIKFPSLMDRSVSQAMMGCLERDPSKRPLIQGPKGLLKHSFLEPRTTPAAAPPSPPSSSSVGAVSIYSTSAVKEIVRRTMEACKSSGSAKGAVDLDALTAHVVDNLKRPDKGNDDSSAAAAVPSLSASTSAPSSQLAHNSSSHASSSSTAAADTPRSQRLRKAREAKLPGATTVSDDANGGGGGGGGGRNDGGASGARPSMLGELVQQRSKLRKASDSVASKYQKPSEGSAGGSGGVFSSMQESSLLNSLQGNLDKRRKGIAGGDDTVNNTGNWGVDDTEASWQMS